MQKQTPDLPFLSIVPRMPSKFLAHGHLNKISWVNIFGLLVISLGPELPNIHTFIWPKRLTTVLIFQTHPKTIIPIMQTATLLAMLFLQSSYVMTFYLLFKPPTRPGPLSPTKTPALSLPLPLSSPWPLGSCLNYHHYLNRFVNLLPLRHSTFLGIKAGKSSSPTALHHPQPWGPCEKKKPYGKNPTLPSSSQEAVCFT